jgi:hypothetical protein
MPQPFISFAQMHVKIYNGLSRQPLLRSAICNCSLLWHHWMTVDSNLRWPNNQPWTNYAWGNHLHLLGQPALNVPSFYRVKTNNNSHSSRHFPKEKFRQHQFAILSWKTNLLIGKSWKNETIYVWLAFLLHVMVLRKIKRILFVGP